ncbi:MAG: PAS domain S-box protein [Pseudomonadota bacterium]
MNLKNKLKLNKAGLIISWFIAFLCFILTLMMSIQKTHVSANSLFWIQGTGIFALLTAMAGALFYDQWRFRILQNQISARSKELKRYEERYRSLVESAEDFIFTVDDSGHFRSLNTFTAAFFGGTPSQFIGQPLSNLFSKEVAEKQLSIIKHVFQVGKSVRDDFMVTTGEHQVLLNANFMPHKDERGNVLSVLCIAIVITESTKLENVDSQKYALTYFDFSPR